MKIVGALMAVVIFIVAFKRFKLEGNDTKISKIGIWNAHKHLQKTGVIFTYIAYFILLMSVLFFPY